MRIKTALTGFAMMIVACGGPMEPSITPDMTVEADAGLSMKVLEITPEECGDCHPNHKADWEGSMHAYASKDPVFLAMLEKGIEETGGKLDQFCIQCHAPVASKTGQTPVVMDAGKATMPLNMDSPNTGDGVVCVACHATQSVEATLNADFTLSEDTLFGPTGSAEAQPAHPVQKNTLFESAVLCGSCHNVVNPKGALLENTFSEWYAGPFNSGDPSVDKSCQDCHMKTYEGEIVEGVTKTIHRHTFVGVDVALIEDFPDKERQWNLMVELLESAAELTVERVADVEGEVALKATVKNVNNGHALPSGSTADRQVWVHIKVFDDQGALLYESGMLDPNGDLMDRVTGHSVTPDGDPELLFFGSLLFDEQDEHVNFPWEAARNQEFLLQPGQTGWREYVIPGAKESGGLMVEATLKYRTFPPFLIRILKEEGYLAEDAISEIPIVDMARKTMMISL